MNLSSAQFEDKPDIFALQNGEYTCSTCVPKIAVKADGKIVEEFECYDAPGMLRQLGTIKAWGIAA